MKLHKISPILWTKNLAETISFYTGVLGFSARSNFPDFVTLTREEVEIMFIVPQDDEGNLSEQQDFFPKSQLTGSLFIVTDDVDALWKSVSGNATIKTPIADRQYLMRDFSILDNNGYELVFGQDISRKVK
jgi:catechol 2,3-dioxygenase-like lactoylglutathione lyase family enzyme